MNVISELKISEEYEIIEQAKEDLKYFKPIYEHYYPDIFRFIFKRMQNENLTADITSEVFLKATVNLKKYEFRKVPFSAWLYRIAINEVNQYYRKHKKIQTCTVDEGQVTELIDDLKTDKIDLEKEIEKLEVAMAKLSTVDRQLIELRFFEQKSFKEIGWILNLKPTNSKIKTYRVLKKLRGLMH
ncbi:MAG: sigma-70 family RNA polymerase sigma factor [Cyclobacteriaceae bacterium]